MPRFQSKNKSRTFNLKEILLNQKERARQLVLEERMFKAKIITVKNAILLNGSEFLTKEFIHAMLQREKIQQRELQLLNITLQNIKRLVVKKIESAEQGLLVGLLIDIDKSNSNIDHAHNERLERALVTLNKCLKFVEKLGNMIFSELILHNFLRIEALNIAKLGSE